MCCRHRLPLLLLLLLFVTPAAAWAQSMIGVMGIPREVAAVEKRLEQARDVTIRGHVFRVGTLHGRDAVVGRAAAGKVNAAIVATLLIDHFNPSVIFFSGTAGAIDPALHQGDVVIGATVAQHDVGMLTSDGIRRRGLRNTLTGELDPLLVAAPESLLTAVRQAALGLTLPSIATAAGARTPRIVEGVIVTGDVFVADPARSEEMRRNLGATAVEMEGAAMVQTCRQFGVECLVIRSITDRADGRAQVSYEAFIAIASENAAAVVAATIASLPSGAP